MQLCIEHLLQLEDSARTRRASVKLLQDNLHLFYPEHSGLVRRCQALANALGGNLEPPRERLHFKLARKALGWEAAKHLRGQLNAFRHFAKRMTEH